MNKHERTKAACERRRKETNGYCEIDDCFYMGWCPQVLEEADNHKKGGIDERHQSGSGAVAPAADD